MKDSITCKEVVELIIDYTEGTLSPEELKDLNIHLKGCIDCDVFLKTYQKTVSISHRLSCEEVPAELRTRLTSLLARWKKDKKN